MELDAVAHGDHDLGALVVVEEVMNGRPGAVVDGAFGVRGDGKCDAAASGIEGECEGDLRIGDAELEGGDGLELGGNVALRFGDEFAVFNVETERRIGLDGVGVLAGEGFKLGGGGSGGRGFRDCLGLRQGPGKSGS